MQDPSFIHSVFSHWGSLVSGVAGFLLSFYEKHKGRAISKVGLRMFTICCLFFAFYLAWEDERQARLEYQLEASNAKMVADYRQRMMDRLQMTINAFKPQLENTNGRLDVGKDAVVMGHVSGNVGDGSVVVGATDSNGNTILTNPMAIGYGAQASPGSIAIGAGAKAGSITDATLISSNNSPIIQQGPGSAMSFNQSGGVTAGTYIESNRTEIYQGPKPFVFRVRLIMTNALENGIYKNIYRVDVGNPSDKMRFHIFGAPPIISAPTIEDVGGGTTYTLMRSFPDIMYNVTVLTISPIPQTNIIFRVETIPEQ
jgi:hypothetical protein